MALSRLVACTLSIVSIVTLAGRADAVVPSELLLPATTKGFISTQDVDEVRNEFNKTQFGEMSHDPVMQPFVDDLKKQIAAKLERAGKKLGIKWPDMEGVYGGEAAMRWFVARGMNDRFRLRHEALARFFSVTVGATS